MLVMEHESLVVFKTFVFLAVWYCCKPTPGLLYITLLTGLQNVSVNKNILVVCCTAALFYKWIRFFMMVCECRCFNLCINALFYFVGEIHVYTHIMNVTGFCDRMTAYFIMFIICCFSLFISAPHWTSLPLST